MFDNFRILFVALFGAQTYYTPHKLNSLYYHYLVHELTDDELETMLRVRAQIMINKLVPEL